MATWAPKFPPNPKLYSEDSPLPLRNIMLPNTNKWDTGIINHTFSPGVAAAILKMKIPYHEEPMPWFGHPLREGISRFKFAYRVQNQSGFEVWFSGGKKKVGKNLEIPSP